MLICSKSHLTLSFLLLIVFSFIFCSLIWEKISISRSLAVLNKNLCRTNKKYQKTIHAQIDSKIKNYRRNNSLESKVKQIKNVVRDPTILVWSTSPFFAQKGIEFFAGKEHGSCHVSMNRSLLNDSIAVVIFNNNQDPLDIPDLSTRKHGQFYVFWTQETPSKTVNFRKSLENPLFDPIFNLSMSLMRTADVQMRFGSYRTSLERAKRRKLTTEDSSVLWKKTKLAVWTVSNCFGIPGANDRMFFARSLVKAGLKLDKHGKCFEGKRSDTKIGSLVENYKFYLAFENSLHCPDYVTEKFWRNAIDSGLVPVVWGPTKQNILEVAPPDSFIHAEDFKTPQDLVKRLNYLDKNYTAYMEYHRWRNTPLRQVKPARGSFNHREQLSILCKRIVVENQPPKVIPSITKLIYETGYTDDECLRTRSPLTIEQQRNALDF